MNPNIGRLKTILEYLGEEFSVEDFDARLKLQKLVYFVQLTGIDLGYRFSWYVHGPYCTELTRTAYSYHENRLYYDKHGPKFRVNSDGQGRLSKVKGLANPPADFPNQRRWLELLASIHYLRHVAYTGKPKKAIDKDYIQEKLQDEKPDKSFTENEVAEAWAALGHLDLIENKMITV